MSEPAPRGSFAHRGGWLAVTRRNARTGTVSGVHEKPATGIAAAGELIVRANVVGTAVFVVTAVSAAVSFTSESRAVAAAVALTLFFSGIGAFLWSFWNAVQRSRGEQVAVTQLYFLTSGVAPARVRATMLSALAVQVGAGLATAIARASDANGNPGTSLALGVLVPIFGFGLNGLWAAYHGSYDQRSDTEAATPKTADVRTTAPSIDQNEQHG